ncbi:MAG: hypothetical protein KGM16_15045 [Bacteroidota bacterium]|nr:hypothetical protein [Bacteroidota bacterium]
MLRNKIVRLTIIFSHLLFALSVTAQKQVPKADSLINLKHTSLLWFTGHWKSNNLFATNNHIDSSGDYIYSTGGSGTNLTVSTDGSISIESKDIDGWNKKIETGLNNLEKYENELQAPANKVNEWSYHFNEVTLPVLDDLKEEWKTYKINGKVLVDTKPDNQKDIANVKGKAKKDTIFKKCSENKPEFHKTMAFYKAHKHDKDAELTYPPPPAYSNQCVSCDTSLEKLYHWQDSVYANKFFEPESDMIKFCIGLMRDIELMGIKDGLPNRTDNKYDMESILYDAFNWSKDPSKSGPCAYMDYSDLKNAVDFLVNREYRKAEKLFKDYNKNVETARPVIKVYLSAIRQMELWGENTDENRGLAECAALIDRVEEYYTNKLFHEHDWSQLANIPFIFGLERQRQLLGGQESDLTQKMTKLLNSFILQIEMDVKEGTQGGYALAHLKGEEKITPEFDYDNDTCYRWVLIKGNNNLGFPKKKPSQQIVCDLLDNELVGPGPRPEYIGTKRYYTILYGLKMDYCHAGKDSIFLSSFVPQPNALAGTWRVPMSPPVPLGINDVDGLFQDVNKRVELVRSGKAKQQAEIMKEQGEQIAAQMKAIQKKMGNGRSASNISDYQKIRDLATQAMSLGTNQNVAPILYIDFPLQIQKLTTTLHNIRFDAKKINPQESEVIVYGYYTIKVIYKPGS